MAPVLLHQSGPELPLSMELAVPVLVVGVAVCLLIAYDAYRTYRPFGGSSGGDR